LTMTSNTTKTIASANGKPVPEREAAQENTLIEELNTKLSNDINHLKSKEKSQINMLQKWQSIFEALNEPAIILDKDHAAVKANQAAYELLSTENEDILGQKCYRLFLGRSSPCTDCSLQPEDPCCRRHEMEVEGRFSGQILRVTCAPVFQETQLVGYIHSALDISHQRNLEKQLVWAQNNQSQGSYHHPGGQRGS